MLDVLFAAETLVPPVGGAERWALELLERLSTRHSVRAVWLGEAHGGPAWLEGITAPAASADGYWQTKAVRRAAVARMVTQALAERRANVVVTQLHAAPAVVRAASEAGAASVLVLPSYESLCKLAFDAGSSCRPETGCRGCPAALALPQAEREALVGSREAHEESLQRADLLVTLSQAVADACEDWCGRRPLLVPGSAALPAQTRADPEGPVVAAARWSENKGVELLEPIAHGLRPRMFRITEGGLEPDLRRRLERLDHVEIVPEAPFAELLAGASVLLVPSQWAEPFGRAALEGLAAGIPVLASATGGLVDFVPGPQLVRDHRDPGAWLTAIAELRDHSDWSNARERGLSAARLVLDEDPAARFEELLLAAAR